TGVLLGGRSPNCMHYSQLHYQSSRGRRHSEGKGLRIVKALVLEIQKMRKSLFQVTTPRSTSEPRTPGMQHNISMKGRVAHPSRCFRLSGWTVLRGFRRGGRFGNSPG